MPIWLLDAAKGRRLPTAGGRRNGVPTRMMGLTAAVPMLALSLGTAGCGLFADSSAQPGRPGVITGFLGGVVADEPRAALIGREVLSTGGDAADAAVAVGFALSVTLPSRAGLGAGGACLAYAPASDSANAGVPEAVLFTPQPGGPGGDRPAAVPMLPRGMYALHTRYGRQPFETLIAPAEQLARTGFRVSRALVRDLQVVASPLMADAGARAIFAPGRKPLEEGQLVEQADLSTTLGQMRTAGIGDLYVGLLGRNLVTASGGIGGPLSMEQVRAALPRTVPPLIAPIGEDQAAFVPPPAVGGEATAAALRRLLADPNAPASLPGRGPYPASTTFATLDRQGNAVVCALTMDNLFGTGRILPGLGFLLAASPARLPQPMLAVGLAWNPSHGFRAEAGGSGQEGAPYAAASALLTSIRAGHPLPAPPPEPGRANVILCGEYLPGSEKSCAWATDPRGAGLAVGGDN